MALRSETAALLAGFEKRMKFINMMRFLLEYSYPNAIQEMIPDKKILDNLVLAVLVYIKDRTLSTEQICTVADVADFLADVAEILPADCHVEPSALARYIVVDVLQNGGVMREFVTLDSVSESFQMQPVRILNEEQGAYHLTDEAFDFLFRSKEIESELDYSVTRFKMKEYMKRDNYENALDASRELVSRILNMKLSMNDFVLRCRENIANITADQYEAVIGRIRALLQDEYEELREIQTAAEQREARLQEALENGIGSEEMRKRRKALQEIVQNISRTIVEQRALINQETEFAHTYEGLIRDNFVVSRFERMNFEKDILAPLRRPGAPLGDAAKQLLFLLTKPRFENRFSLENFYAPQSKLNPDEEDPGLDLTQEDSDEAERIEQRNRRNRTIVERFFAYATDHPHFAISEFVGTLSVADLVETCAENALPRALLAICSLQELDLDGWKASEKFHVVPNGEFELAWCLTELPETLLQMHSLSFTRRETTFCFAAQRDGVQRRIDMSDFEVEVTV